MHKQALLYYPSLVHATIDLHEKKQYSILVQHVGVNWNDVAKQILLYANNLFDGAVNLLQNVAWESLYALGSVPNYLLSLLRVIEKLLLEKSLSSTLYDAFYVGASKLWTMISQLLPSTWNTQDIASLLEGFADALKTYGSRIWQAMQYLFSGVKKLVNAVLVLYNRAVAKLSAFSCLFVTTMSNISQMKHQCTQTVIFSFMLLQNVMELGTLKANAAIEYLQMHSERLFRETTVLRSFAERINPTGKLIQVLVENETLRNLLSYIGTSLPFLVFKRVFQFLHDIISNIITTLSGYITAFAVQGINYLSEVFAKIIEVPTFETVFSLSNAAKELIENEKVSIPDKQYLKEAVEIATAYEAKMRAFNKYSDLPRLFYNTWFAARVVSDIYYEIPVSEADKDRVVKDATGFNMRDFLQMNNSMTAYLHGRISVVYSATFDQEQSKEKMKIDAEFLGVRNDDNWAKEEFEKKQEIREIEAKIERLQNRIYNLMDTDTYQDEMRVYNALRQKAVQETASRGPQATVIYLSDLEKIKENIDNKAGILELRNEIVFLKEQRVALQRSINQKKGWVKQNKGPLVILITAITFGVVAYYMMEERRRDARAASELVFKDLLSASKHDPILYGQVNMFIEREGINLLTSSQETLTRFQKFVSDIAFDIGNKKIDVETTEKEWSLLISSSIRMHETRQVEKESPSLVSGAITAFWSVLSGEQKSTDLVVVEATKNANNVIEKTFDAATIGLLKNVDMSTFHLGWKAYPGKDVVEKQDAYVTDVSNILRAHFTAMSGIFGAERQRLSAKTEVGIMKQLAQWISFGFRQTGVAGADTETTKKEMQEMLASGGVGFLVQQFIYYEANLVFVATGIRIVLFTIAALVESLLNVIIGEHDVAYRLLLDLSSEIFRGFAIVSASWIKSSANILAGRFMIIGVVFQILWSILTIFTPAAWVWWGLKKTASGLKSAWTYAWSFRCCRGKAVEKAGRAADAEVSRDARDALRLAASLVKRGDGAFKTDAQICMTCNSNIAYSVCGHCKSVYYCSEGCADLNWAQHAQSK